jgi:hypothetical protein
MHILCDSILTIRKCIREKCINFDFCLRFNFATLGFEIVDRTVDKAIEVSLVDKRPVDTAVPISINERPGSWEGSDHMRVQYRVIRVHGRAVQGALSRRIY